MDNPISNPPLNIRALLVAKNIKQIEIARRFFIDPSEVNKVVKGTRKTPHIRQAIALALDMSPDQLWGNAA